MKHPRISQADYENRAVIASYFALATADKPIHIPLIFIGFCFMNLAFSFIPPKPDKTEE